MTEQLISKMRKHPLVLFPDFRRLFAGRLVAQTGDKFFALALAWWVVSQTGESKAHLGYLMAVNFLPVVLFGPFMGALADRFDRRRCMMFADLFRFSVVALLCALLYFGRLSLPLLYALVFLIAVFVPLFESSVSSSLVDLTDAEHLAPATAADASCIQLSAVAGAALGSVFLAATGVLGAFAANALAFLVSFLAVFGIRTPLAPKGGASAGYLSELKAGVSYITSSRPLLALLVVFSVVNFFAAPLLIIMPMLVKFSLNETAVWLAVFETFFAAGSAAVAITLSLRPGQGSIYAPLSFSMISVGLLFGSLGFVFSKALLCLLLLVIGAMLALGNAKAMIFFQHVVPDEMKGRFFAALYTLCFAVVPLSLALNGVLAEKMPLSVLCVLNGAGAALLGLVILAIPRMSPAASGS